MLLRPYYPEKPAQLRELSLESLGVVGGPKAAGRIARAAPVIEHLQRIGLYVSAALVQQLLREVGQ